MNAHLPTSSRISSWYIIPHLEGLRRPTSNPLQLIQEITESFWWTDIRMCQGETGMTLHISFSEMRLSECCAMSEDGGVLD